MAFDHVTDPSLSIEVCSLDKVKKKPFSGLLTNKNPKRCVMNGDSHSSLVMLFWITQELVGCVRIFRLLKH